MKKCFWPAWAAIEPFWLRLSRGRNPLVSTPSAESFNVLRHLNTHRTPVLAPFVSHRLWSRRFDPTVASGTPSREGDLAEVRWLPHAARQRTSPTCQYSTRSSQPRNRSRINGRCSESIKATIRSAASRSTTAHCCGDRSPSLATRPRFSRAFNANGENEPTLFTPHSMASARDLATQLNPARSAWWLKALRQSDSGNNCRCREKGLFSSSTK